MDEQRNSFLKQVRSQIKSKEAKALVSAELHHHLNEVKHYWLQKGISEDQAEEKAVNQMGNPISIGQKLNRIHRPKVDWVTLILFVSALLLGFLPLLSQGYMQSNHFSTYKVAFIIVGGMVALGMMFIDYRKLANKGWLFYLLGLLFLIFLTRNFNTVIEGQSILKIGPLNIESLIAIPFFLLAWAGFFQSNRFKMWKFLLLFVLSLYFFLECSLTTLFIYVTMTFTMILWSKLKKKTIWIVLGSIFSLVGTWGVIGWMTVAYYQKYRILSFINPYNSEYLTSKFGLLKIHHLFMNAGWFGKHSFVDQFIPQAHTNFVFLSFTYYYGWLFAAILFLVLSLVAVRIISIARSLNDTYSKLLLVGVMMIYMVQLVGNVGMIVGFFPMTNISLPFISYGVMPILLNAFLIGIVLSIYRRKNLLSANTLHSND
ncbi:FtsW/RodA/SpoVE family cell cycle protein [Priestia aryabhattai]|jgi:cell division protein FtsW (lipid II flippase)|uniref:FtsW/RodA/SpoVE family cell cycle protein n=1 Tax=Priestia aryabhattai TaxID=412384 RepID=UPI001CCE3A10|nr:FtsW/RodA/SpoVE family cell cycle protein [Priestia aryabhattai]MBZ6488505.1 FtsW/RodA/SpoVE family cell cycle protein [Priestia aryabhattai]MDH3111121.1 FtsW/RodA/SpoVE family cell cycle protein [Priestia aryabhattai]MDH3129790.1 FtsW/RodA/SpoVE family cell cycle protein [Priestia aryabhattai]MDH3130266.1 FtsW/RodA/SpoVE family cell cycle protein [Priestia aryabhattai]